MKWIKHALMVITLLFYLNSFAAKDVDVLVIGGGVAGITSAYTLMQAGKKTVILEASRRLGGRVNTDYSFGYAVDLGGAWLHGIHHNPLLPLTEHHPFIANSYSYSDELAMLKSFALYNSNGEKISKNTKEKFYTLANDFIDFYDGKKQTTIASGFNHFVKEKPLASLDKQLLHYALDNIYTYEYAVNLDQLAHNEMALYDKSTSSGPNGIFPGGFITLFKPMEKNLRVIFNQEVNKIDYHDNKVLVSTKNHQYQAKAVIVTVPLGVLKANHIRFIPVLPRAKQQAIKQMQMGRYEKLVLQFDKVFWDKNSEWIGAIPHDTKNAFNIFNLYKYTNHPVLVAFTSGTLARRMNNANLKNWVMVRLKRIYGNNIPAPQKSIQTHWQSKPLFLGSYSVLPPGVDKIVIKELAAPIGNKVFFAGEATSSTDPSTVHGAYLTGLKAANLFLRNEKKQAS